MNALERLLKADAAKVTEKPKKEIEIPRLSKILGEKFTVTVQALDTELLAEITENHKGHIVSATQYRSGGGGYALFESHNHDIDNDYTDTETTTDSDLKAGYYVAMFPIQDSTDGTKQKYVVLCHITRGWTL